MIKHQASKHKHVIELDSTEGEWDKGFSWSWTLRVHPRARSGISLAQPVTELLSDIGVLFSKQLLLAIGCNGSTQYYLWSALIFWRESRVEYIKTISCLRMLNALYWSSVSSDWGWFLFIDSVLWTLPHRGCWFLGTDSHMAFGHEVHLFLTSLITSPQPPRLEWGPRPGLPNRVSLVY